MRVSRISPGRRPRISIAALLLALVGSPLLHAQAINDTQSLPEDPITSASDCKVTIGTPLVPVGPYSARIPSNVYENLQNTVGGVQFYSSNYGIFGLDIKQVGAGVEWPFGSGKHYIFGGGLWFGAVKKVYDPTAEDYVRNKLSVITYDPNTGQSWFVPGAITGPIDSDGADHSADGINLNRLYISTEYDPETGEPLDAADRISGGPNWPIWAANGASPGGGGAAGIYVDDPAERSTSLQEEGPVMISDQDVASVYKDTDLSVYSLGEANARADGYPLGLQVEQMVYTWEDTPLKDVVILRYRITNRSSDTLENCYLGSVMDVDIGQSNNDRLTTVIPDRDSDDLNLTMLWTEPEEDVYGYLGIDLVETPAVRQDNFLRTDKQFYSQDEQLGLTTAQNWMFANDPQTPQERYDFMAAATRVQDNGPGDKRSLSAVGPFYLRPGESTVFAVALIFANGTGPVQDGSVEDAANLIELSRFVQKAYDSTVPLGVEESWSPVSFRFELR